MKRLFPVIGLLVLTACSFHAYRMNELDSRLELTLADLDISEPVTAQSTVNRVLGIDFQRLFAQEAGAIDLKTPSEEGWLSAKSRSTASVNTLISTSGTFLLNSIGSIVTTVIGPVLGGDAGTYALYNLMSANPGYDIILYPKFEKVSRGFPPFYTTTTVKVTARLGRLRGM